tara:strand:+ start:1388 stop:1729 length:342 start_codon:yes stop_codon:yes gene_type:complete
MDKDIIEIIIDKKYSSKLKKLDTKINKIEKNKYNYNIPQSIQNHYINMISASIGCVALLLVCEYREKGYEINKMNMDNIDWGYSFIYGFVGYNVRTLVKKLIINYNLLKNSQL